VTVAAEAIIVGVVDSAVGSYVWYKIHLRM
jgi:hypothetical protein